MLLGCIRAEKMKWRRAPFKLLFFLIPIFPAIIGTVNYIQNIGMLSEQWYSLWTQHTLFYSNFFFAPSIAIYCSYLWRLEHLNRNWNSFMTMPVPIPALYLAKFYQAARTTLLLQLLVGILFLISGKYVGLPGFPPAQIWLWLLRGTLGAFTICAVQLLLSMKIRSFSVPVIIALLGSIAGLLLTTKGWGIFWPYSLMMLGMNANKSSDQLAGSVLAFTLAILFYLLLFSLTSVFLLKKQDVHT